MTSSDIGKAIEAMGNGGKITALYRAVRGIAGTLIFLMVTDIRDNRKEFISSIAELKSNQGVHASEIQNLKERTAKRYTSDQADTERRAQALRDEAQDKDRERIERRLEVELRRFK